jgi:hypothetical protein
MSSRGQGRTSYLQRELALHICSVKVHIHIAQKTEICGANSHERPGQA